MSRHSTPASCASSAAPARPGAALALPTAAFVLLTAALAASLAALLSACVPAPLPPTEPAGDAARGQRLIAQYQCGRCHQIPGVAAADGRRAASLEAFGRRSYIAGQLPNRPDMLVAWIVDPPALVPGTAMPKLGVAAAEARDMAAYLGGLQ